MTPKAATYLGACDASAAVAIGARLLVAATDEDNVLRIYDRRAPGPPVARVDLGPFLASRRKDGDGDDGAEADIEGAARLGDRVYWITSHARDSRNRVRKSRRQFFATAITASPDGPRLEPMGRPYTDLVRDLLDAPSLRGFGLKRAAARGPEERGA